VTHREGKGKKGGRRDERERRGDKKKTKDRDSQEIEGMRHC
jgi:hypothetical protein